MAGSHLSSGSSSYSSRSNRHHRRRRGGGGIVVLIIALVIIIAVLGCFVASNVFGISLFDNLPFLSSSSASGTSVNGTTVAVYDASGKDVTKNVTISAGTLSPDTLDSTATPVLLNTSWTGMLATNYPVIVSVSNISFTNDDGLKVYQYNGTGWTELGTYLISGNSVAFQTYSLSAFAFEVISSEPETTPTPEPTATPEATEEMPTVDYGTYATEVDGLFVDTDYITADGEYIIGVLNDDNEDDLTATVVLHYGDGELAAMDVAVQQTESGRYYILDPVVEGMLWKAVNSDNVINFDRYALANNDEYLNLNTDCTGFILDNDPDGRTRWLYETFGEDGAEALIGDDDDEAEGFLTYYNEENLYYLESTDDFAASTVRDDSLKVILFCLNGSTERPLSDEEEVEADAAKTTNSSGTILLTTEPTGVSGISATPVPTAAAPQNTDAALVPVTDNSGNSGSSSATAAPQATETGDDAGGSGSGSSTGGGSDSGSSTSGGSTSGGSTSGGSTGGGSAASGSDSGSSSTAASGR